jgi:predicted Abi (CAAX) family protease
MRAMKAIWTVLFVACLVAALGIAMLLVPDYARDDRFWLCTAGVGLGLFFIYLSIVVLPKAAGEQGQEVLHFQSLTGSILYLVAVLGLAGISATGLSFRWLAVLHILALLMWVLLVGLGAIGSQAMKRADELTK